jgi:hypothetical protein
MKFLRRVFGLREEKYKIVEVEPYRLLDKEFRESARLLPNNPGFIWLMQKLRLQRALLESELKRRQPTLADVEWLQNGIKWLSWIESTINEETKMPKRPSASDAPSLERELFDQAQAAIRGIGE